MKATKKPTWEVLLRLSQRHGVDREILAQIWPPVDETITVDDIDVSACKGDESANRRSIIHFLKDLDAAGYGRFITGRKGYKSRFEWGLPALQVTTNESTSQMTREEAPAVITHRFALRIDYHVSIDLPSDMTEAEARRLSMFINSLPFSSSDG